MLLTASKYNLNYINLNVAIIKYNLFIHFFQMDRSDCHRTNVLSCCHSIVQ